MIVADFRKDMMKKYCLYPNQNGRLCKSDDLYINNGIDDDLLDFYKKAINKDLREELVNDDFKDLVKIEEIAPKNIANEIEEKLDENKFEDQLTIDIIQKLEDGKWQGLFKYIESHKEELFFTSVKGSDKTNVYKLMKSDSKTLQMLADLSDNPNVKEILDKAQELIERERYKRHDFEFKHGIGVHIEELIRKKLNQEINIEQANIDDIQNGQDLIVYYQNQPVYFIEVKAKWNFSEPAHMSKNQMKNAYRNQSRYALCCVDLTNGGFEEHFYPDIDTIVNNSYIHTDIGKQLALIMNGVSSADQDYDGSITMGGDYRCNIPKKIFVNGTPFDSLVNAIASAIQN